MANVIFAARKATSDALSTVSTTTASIAAVAETLAIYAEDYRDQTKQELAQSAKARSIQKTAERALSLATFHKDLKVSLDKDPELQSFYTQALKELDPTNLNKEKQENLKAVPAA